MDDLYREVLDSPGACVILIHRARLSAQKQGDAFDKALRSGLRQPTKLRSALNAARGLSMRAVYELIEDEQAEFQQVEARRAEDAVQLASFIEAVAATAETIVPGLSQPKTHPL